MSAKRRWLVGVIVLLWVAGMGVWGWNFLGFATDSVPTVANTSPSVAPIDDSDDRFESVDALCEDLDWSGLETAVGKVWIDLSDVSDREGTQANLSLACQASAPFHDKAYAIVSASVYSSASQAMSEYDSTLLTADTCTDSFREDITDDWSRSWGCVISIDADDRMTYIIIAQVDNLAYQFNLVVPNTIDFQTDEYAAGIEREGLRMGEQIQQLATKP